MRMTLCSSPVNTSELCENAVCCTGGSVVPGCDDSDGARVGGVGISEVTLEGGLLFVQPANNRIHNKNTETIRFINNLLDWIHSNNDITINIDVYKKPSATNKPQRESIRY